MDRRTLLLSGLAAGVGLGTSGCATAQVDGSPDYQTGNEQAQPYTEAEIVKAGSNFLGVTAEALGGVIERIFSDYGDRPTGYIAGEEGSAALTVGLRYGQGLLHSKVGEPHKVYWQGPSIGWDVGGNAARVFTLCYGLYHPEAIYRRFPGVEGSAYLVGGLGVNYQNADGIVLAPIRAGVGVRLGASVGYLAYSRKRNLLPF